MRVGSGEQVTPQEILALWDAATALYEAQYRALTDPSVPMEDFSRAQRTYDSVAECAVKAMGGWSVVSSPAAVAHGRAR